MGFNSGFKGLNYISYPKDQTALWKPSCGNVSSLNLKKYKSRLSRTIGWIFQ